MADGASCRLPRRPSFFFSAALDGGARLILENLQVDKVVTVEQVIADVEKYTGRLARKKWLAEDLVFLPTSALPVTVIEGAAYAAAIPEAKKRIGQRDPADIEHLALALNLDVPVWSNDKDFEDTGSQWLTTEELLRHLALNDAF